MLISADSMLVLRTSMLLCLANKLERVTFAREIPRLNNVALVCLAPSLRVKEDCATVAFHFVVRLLVKASAQEQSLWKVAGNVGRFYLPFSSCDSSSKSAGTVNRKS